jgi:hypothetical protein
MKSFPKKQKDKNDKNDKNDKKDQRKSYRKRNTITNDKSFFKKSLFGSRDARVDIKRLDSHLSTEKHLNLNIIEMDDDEPNKRAKEKNKGKKRKISSSRVLKEILSIKKEKIFGTSNKKKTLRRMQTLKAKKEDKEKILSDLRKMKNSKFNKNPEINKNDDSGGPLLTQISKEHLMSSKFQRPSKFLFSNNINTTNSSNNQNTINREGSKTKINSLFDYSRFSSSKDKKAAVQSCFNNKEKDKDKDKEKTRSSMRKQKKYIK